MKSKNMDYFRRTLILLIFSHTLLILCKADSGTSTVIHTEVTTTATPEQETEVSSAGNISSGPVPVPRRSKEGKPQVVYRRGDRQPSGRSGVNDGSNELAPQDIVNCDIDTLICVAVSGNNSQYYWSRRNAQSISHQYRPAQDHTHGTSNGYYMVVIQNPNVPYATQTTLTTALINTGSFSSFCVSYHVYAYQGNGAGYLTVYLENSGSSTKQELRREPATFGTTWTKKSLSLKGQTTAFKILFTAQSGAGSTAVLAIDDIKIATEECQDTYGPWTQWTSCSGSCGSGTSTRTRSCSGSCSAQTESRLCSLPPCLSAQSACGGGTQTMGGTLGFVYSPGYPNMYGQDENCKWIINVASNKKVELEFVDFEVESGYDFLDVYDGSSTSATKLGRYTGSKTGSKTESTGPSVLLHFDSDNIVHKKGFKIKYQEKGTTTETWGPWLDWGACSATCGEATKSRQRTCSGTCQGGSTQIETQSCNLPACPLPPPTSVCNSQPVTLTSETGDIYTPGYQQGINYGVNQVCQWLIALTSSKKITLTLVDFTTESGYDYLYVYDGTSQSSPNIGTFTGSHTGVNVTSSGRNMLLKFYSDNVYPAKGFHLKYQAKATTTQGWGPWTIWGPCSGTCGVTTKSRQRTCSGTCQGGSTQIETATCNLPACPTSGPGTWKDWSPWGQCNITCGGGYQSRTRLCDGSGCVGNSTEFKICNTAACNAGSACDGQPQILTAESGVIYSTGYQAGGNYVVNQVCQWLISLSGASNEVEITIVEFTVETSYDYLEIYDGPNTASTKLKTFTGTVPPQTVTSSGPKVLLRFVSDNIVTKRGFKLEYKVKKIDNSNSWDDWSQWGKCSATCGNGNQTRSRSCPGNGCNGNSTEAKSCSAAACPDVDPCSGQVKELSGDSGFIYSQNYGQGNYKTDSVCQWRYSVVPPKEIVLEFIDFLTEQNYDYLYVYNGSTTTGTVPMRFSGNMTGFKLSASSSSVLIRFVSDPVIPLKGFKIKYMAIAPNMFGEWSPWGACSVTCGNGTQTRNRNCTTSGCTNPTSETQTCTLAPCPSMAGCQGQVHSLPGVSGFAYSPGYPEGFTYMNDLDCKWLITVDPSKGVDLNFVDFITDQNKDYLLVYNGPDDTSTLIGNYSGSQTGTTFQASSNKVLLHFKTDPTLREKGFKIEYQEAAVNTSWSHWSPCSVTCGSGISSRTRNCPSTGCSGPATEIVVCTQIACSSLAGCDGQPKRFLRNQGFILSPGHAAGNPYLNDLSCTWIITVNEEKIVRLTFHNFYTESNNDVLKIYDGNSTSSTLLESFSGNKTGVVFFTTGRYALLQFDSNGASTDKGFEIEFNARYPNRTCKGTKFLNQSSGVINTPGFRKGLNYIPDLNCKWVINVTTNAAIKLEFVTFETQAGADEMYIRDGYLITSPLIGTYSGDKTGTVFVTPSSVAFVNFKSDSSVSAKGFKIKFSEEVGSKSSGNIP